MYNLSLNDKPIKGRHVQMFTIKENSIQSYSDMILFQRNLGHSLYFCSESYHKFFKNEKTCRFFLINYDMLTVKSIVNENVESKKIVYCQ